MATFELAASSSCEDVEAFAGLLSPGWVVADESAGLKIVLGPAKVIAPAINTNTSIRTRTVVLTMFKMDLP